MLNDLYEEDQPIVETGQMPDDESRNDYYPFATGELAPSEQLDAFMQEFAVDKEEKGAADEPTPEEIAEIEENEENEEEISTQTARNTAQFIVSMLDEGASTGLAYLSKDKQDDFRAGKDQLKNLENIITKLCKEKGTEIPLGWQIFFCIATIYGAKIPYALDRRAINKEKAEIEEIKASLRKQQAEIDERLQEIETERKTLRSIREDFESKKANAGV